jgi:hypothetical protein
MNRFFGTAVPLGAILVALMLVAGAASVQSSESQVAEAQGATTATTPVPRTSWDKKPDLTGVWQGAALSPRAYGLAELERLYLPSAKEKMKVLTEKDDPVSACIPFGFPRSLALSVPFQIIQAVGAMLILSDHPHIYRYIPTDGRNHTEDIFPTYLGDSVGHWEGDTLVVDVSALNGRIWLAGAKDHPTPGGTGGWITSDALHIVERWRLADADTLEYQAVVEDPKVLSKAWTAPKIVLKRAPIRKIGEGHCIPAHIDYKAPALR